MLQLDIHFPWWLWIGLAFVGGVLFQTGNRRMERRLRTAGLALVCLAGLMLVVNLLVETPMQRCQRLSKELAEDVVNQRWDRARQIMDPNTSFAVTGSAVEGKFNRDQIIAAAQDAVSRYGVKSITVTSVEPVRTDTLITVSMTVFTTQDATMDRPLSTSWEFDWQEIGSNWKLQRLVLLNIGGETSQLQNILK
jgi:hypothetical protein